MFDKLKFWKSESRSGSGLEIEGESGDDLVLLTSDGQAISQAEEPEAFATMLTRGGGRVVNRTTALSLSAVYACVDRIASNIAMMPVEVKQTKGNDVKLVESHDATFLLNNKPNDWQSPFLLKQLLMIDVLTDGNGYLKVESTRRGDLLGFKWFDAKAVGMYNTGRGRWTYQATDDEGESYVIFPDEMFHIRALGNKGRKGISPIQLHAQLIKMGLDAQDYGANFFGSGGKPSGVVGVKGGNLNGDSMNNLKSTWRKAAQEADSNNRVIFLPADVTYSAISISPIDAQFIESSKMTRSEVAGIYNVPAYLIGDLDKANYSNITQQSISFVRNTLQPWITAIEMEMNMKVFTEKELRSGLGIHFDMDVLVRGTPVERAQIAHYAVTDGWKNRNEVRTSEGLPRVEGQDMDKYMISVNAVKPGDNSNQNGDNANNGDNGVTQSGISGDNSLNPNGQTIEGNQ
nr:MAG: portal protein [Bacteriophage sp.]